MPRRRSDFDAFCQTAFDFLDRAGVRYLVIGGVALLAVGEPRTTADVDVLGFFPAEGGKRLIDEAIRAGFDTNPEAEAERLARTGTLRFCRPPFQLDVILASLPFEESAYERSTEYEIFGRRIRFPSPEDLILFKILAGREKDLLDAMGVARRHAAVLDRKYLEQTLQPICDLAEDLMAWRRLQDLLERVRI